MLFGDLYKALAAGLAFVALALGLSLFISIHHSGSIEHDLELANARLEAKQALIDDIAARTKEADLARRDAEIRAQQVEQDANNRIEQIKAITLKGCPGASKALDTFWGNHHG